MIETALVMAAVLLAASVAFHSILALFEKERIVKELMFIKVGVMLVVVALIAILIKG